MVVSVDASARHRSGEPAGLGTATNGRLCLTYGYRAPPFAIHARQNPLGQDVDWPFVSYAATAAARTLAMPVPSFGQRQRRHRLRLHDHGELRADIEATIWSPGSR